jgi:hypothetical protein
MVTHLPHFFALWDPYSRSPRVELFQAEMVRGAVQIHPTHLFRSDRTLEAVIDEIHWNRHQQDYRAEIRLRSERRTIFVCDTGLYVRITQPQHSWREIHNYEMTPLLMIWHPPLTVDPTPPEVLYIQGFARWEQELLRAWERLLRIFHLPTWNRFPPYPPHYIENMIHDYERNSRRRRGRARRREETDSDSSSEEEEVSTGGAAGGARPAAPAPAPAPAPPAAPPAERIALAIARDFIATKEVCPITQSPLTQGRIAVAACNCVFQAEGLETWAAGQTTCPSCRTTLVYRVVSV